MMMNVKTYHGRKQTERDPVPDPTGIVLHNWIFGGKSNFLFPLEGDLTGLQIGLLMFRSAATHIRLIKPKSSLRVFSTIPNRLSLASASAAKATTINTTTTFIRAMSSEALKYQFVVYAPDKANALPNRLAVREKHLQNAKELKEAGVLS